MTPPTPARRRRQSTGWSNADLLCNMRSVCRFGLDVLQCNSSAHRHPAARAPGLFLAHRRQFLSMNGFDYITGAGAESVTGPRGAPPAPVCRRRLVVQIRVHCVLCSPSVVRLRPAAGPATSWSVTSLKTCGRRSSISRDRQAKGISRKARRKRCRRLKQN